MRKALVWASISILTLIAIIVGTSWYLLRPNNEFRLALSPMLLHDDAKRGLSNSLFNEIHAAIPTIAEYHAALSFKDKYRAINPVPEETNTGRCAIGRYINRILNPWKTRHCAFYHYYFNQCHSVSQFTLDTHRKSRLFPCSLETCRRTLRQSRRNRSRRTKMLFNNSIIKRYRQHRRIISRHMAANCQ